MSTPLTMEKITNIRPGWRIRAHFRDGDMEATVVQHFNGALLLAPSEEEVVTLGYSEILDGVVPIVVIDSSQGLEIEEIEGPPGGLSTIERVGEDIITLSHDDPVQSGPITTHVAHPIYDEPDVLLQDQRVLVTIHLPMNALTVVAIIEALTEEFPNARVSESSDEHTMMIVEE